MKGALTVLVLALVWQALVWATGVPPYILPAPLAVVAALWANAGELAASAAVTGGEVLVGMLVGTVLGIAVALAMALSERLRGIVRPALVMSQAVPVFALAPILTLWMGYGLGSKIVITVLIVFFPLTSVFLDGLLATPDSVLDLGRLAGASRWRVLMWLRIPHALPALGSGLAVAAVYAPIGAVIGEWVGASRGLGYVMLMANARSKIDLMFAALAVLVAMTMCLHWLAGRLTRWLAD